ncbi:MAG: hypothetical protein KDD40_04330, partial [Bdellovibrionales bacterium]|nr:hypothetical protein [Bdellovibrionales bacterium]
HISRLKPNVTYEFVAYNDKYKMEIDRRTFSTLTLDKKNVQFVVASCMSDHFRYRHITKRIWQQIVELKPDLLLLVGDNVYVDDLDLVSRANVSAFDIWQRYSDSINNTPIYHKKHLIPILATWDDHDYGVDN